MLAPVLRQFLQIVLIVGGREKSLLSSVTADGDVVEGAGEMHAKVSWHDGCLAQEDFNKQILTPLSLYLYFSIHEKSLRS